MYPCVLSFFSKRKKVIPSILSHRETLPFKYMYIYILLRMSLEPPPSKPIIASCYKLRPGFGGQAYDCKTKHCREIPRIIIKTQLFLSIKARICFQVSMYLWVFLFANHDRLKIKKNRGHTMLGIMGAASTTYLDDLW